MTIFLDISQWPFYKNTMTPFNVLHAAFLLEKKNQSKTQKLYQCPDFSREYQIFSDGYQC